MQEMKCDNTNIYRPIIVNKHNQKHQLSCAWRTINFTLCTANACMQPMYPHSNSSNQMGLHYVCFANCRYYAKHGVYNELQHIEFDYLGCKPNTLLANSE